jgi:benzoyl-CoA reductase/2-hydroxyglutaryl-CoA dehydratase subunit BcrC/BadD/HgdB
MISEFKPLGVIDLVWQACLTYDVESVRVRRHLEEKHGLPVISYGQAIFDAQRD